MRITTKARHGEITATARKILNKRAVVAVMSAVESTGTPARYEDGIAGARHYIGTLRLLARSAPRTIRTTHDGRRVAQRRTGRLTPA